MGAGSKIGIYDLMNRAEFAGHYKKLHKGTVVLGLTPRAVDPAAEITVRAFFLFPSTPLFSFPFLVLGVVGRESGGMGVGQQTLPRVLCGPGLRARQLPRPARPLQGMPLGPYMVAFSYGSVVFFNTDK